LKDAAKMERRAWVYEDTHRTLEEGGLQSMNRRQTIVNAKFLEIVTFENRFRRRDVELTEHKVIYEAKLAQLELMIAVEIESPGRALMELNERVNVGNDVYPIERAHVEALQNPQMPEVPEDLPPQEMMQIIDDSIHDESRIAEAFEPVIDPLDQYNRSPAESIMEVGHRPESPQLPEVDYVEQHDNFENDDDNEDENDAPIHLATPMQVDDIMEFFNNHPLLQNDPSHRNNDDDEPIDDEEEPIDDVEEPIDDEEEPIDYYYYYFLLYYLTTITEIKQYKSIYNVRISV